MGKDLEHECAEFLKNLPIVTELIQAIVEDRNTTVVSPDKLTCTPGKLATEMSGN